MVTVSIERPSFMIGLRLAFAGLAMMAGFKVRVVQDITREEINRITDEAAARHAK